MNPWYSLMESRYRWQCLAAISFGVGCVGAMMMIVYTWSHDLARIWFYVGALLTVFFLVRAVLDWLAPSPMQANLQADQPVQHSSSPQER